MRDVGKSNGYQAVLDEVENEENPQKQALAAQQHFLVAAERNNIALVRHMHEKFHVSINTCNGSGDSALVLAAKNDAESVVRYLLQKGAKPTRLLSTDMGVHVKGLLDYKPGRKERSIYQYIQSERDHTDAAYQRQLSNLLADYDDTSEESSSDFSDDDIIEMDSREWGLRLAAFPQKECSLSKDESQKIISQYNQVLENQEQIRKDYERNLSRLNQARIPPEAPTGDDDMGYANNELQSQRQAELESLQRKQDNLRAKKRMLEESRLQLNESVRVILHRGLHFSPAYFSKSERRQYRSREGVAHRCQSLSHCLQDQLRKEFGVSAGADDALNRLSRDKIESSFSYKALVYTLAELRQEMDTKKSKSRFHLLLEEYTTKYDALLNRGGIKEYGFLSGKNPFVSCSFDIRRAFRYAIGSAMQDKLQKDAHYRRSTLKPKHPVRGIVYSYAFPPSFVDNRATHVMDRVASGELTIGKHYRYDCEFIFEGFIPDEFIVKATLLTLPTLSPKKGANLREFKQTSPRRYGFNKPHSQLHSAGLKATTLFSEHSQKKESTDLCEGAATPKKEAEDLPKASKRRNEYTKRLSDNQSMFFQNVVEKAVSQAGLAPAYPYTNGSLFSSPIPVKRDSCWGTASLDSISRGAAISAPEVLVPRRQPSEDQDDLAYELGRRIEQLTI